MSILVNKDTRVVISGITGNTGSFHTRQCMEYGSKIVAGVTPGKGGMLFDDSLIWKLEKGRAAGNIRVVSWKNPISLLGLIM